MVDMIIKKEGPSPVLRIIHDRIMLTISLIIVSPLIVLAVLVVVIGYPIHLIREKIRK